MAGSQIPGPLGIGSNVSEIDKGTLPLTDTPSPAPVGMSMDSSAANPKGATDNAEFSAQGLTLLKQVERLHLKPYNDQTGKEISDWIEGATIGYGHLITKGEWDIYKNGITAPTADALFSRDLAPFVNTVRASIKVRLKQNQFDALVIFAFNIGPDAFSGSSVVALINDTKAHTQYKNLEAAWKAWNKSQGKVMPGLTNRRQCEWSIYSQGIYSGW